MRFGYNFFILLLLILIVILDEERIIIKKDINANKRKVIKLKKICMHIYNYCIGKKRLINFIAKLYNKHNL